MDNDDDLVVADVEVPKPRPAPPPQPSQSTSGNIQTNAPSGRIVQLFDVDTEDVKERVLLAINPLSKEPFLTNGMLDAPLSSIVGGKMPDLWGPVWIYETVVFAMFVSNSLSGLISWDAPINIDLLIGSMSLLFLFTFAVPGGLWLVIHFYNLVPTLTLAQIICLYGYANTIWVPIVAIVGSPLTSRHLLGRWPSFILQWGLASVGFVVSGKFIASNLRNIMHEPEGNDSTRKFLLGGVVLVNTLFTFLIIRMLTRGI